MERKVIQLAVAAAGDGTEYLYALDSTGQIWWWNKGWTRMVLPWDDDVDESSEEETT